VGQIYARQTCALSLLDQTTGSFVRTVFTCRRLSDLACVVLCILPDSPSRSLNSISTLNRRSQTSELAFVLKSTLRPPSPSAALWSPARHRAVFLCLARSPAIVYNSVAAKFCFPEDDITPARRHPPVRASPPENSLAAPRTHTPVPCLPLHGEVTSCYSPHRPTTNLGLRTIPPPFGLQIDVKEEIGKSRRLQGF
jgi:hypothetical protein